MDADTQKKIFEVRILEEQIRQLEEQMGLIDREILEMQTMQANLDEIKKINQKEVIIPLGKSIFIKSKIDSGEKVLVDVGSRILIKKDTEGAKKTIERRKEKFQEARERITQEADRIINEMDRVGREIAAMQK